MEQRQTTVVNERAEVVQNHADMPVDYAGYPTIPVGAEYPRDPVIIDRRDDVATTSTTGKKPGFGAKIKNLFGGKKNKRGNRNVQGAQGGTIVDEHVHTKTVTTTTTTSYPEGQVGYQHQHVHGPLVANPYAQPAHGQIFVPANTAVQANPETGALLPASSINGPVILPTGPKVIPIATNYPAGEAGPMVIPPSGGFINNSGNPYLTQQTYGPSGVLPTQTSYSQNTYQERDVVDNKAAAKQEKQMEKEQRAAMKDQQKYEKQLEKEQQQALKDQEKLDRQIAKDQEKMDRQLAKDQERLAKDQQKLENQLEKDQANMANNQAKLQNNIEKNESKLQNQISKDEMKIQETLAKEQAAGQTAAYSGYGAQPLTTGYNTVNAGGAHGVKHEFAEETKQDAYTGQVLDHHVYHKDTNF